MTLSEILYKAADSAEIDNLEYGKPYDSAVLREACLRDRMGCVEPINDTDKVKCLRTWTKQLWESAPESTTADDDTDGE